MLSRVRSVEVHQVPEKVNVVRELDFVRALRESVTTERPRFVLDCSKVVEMNSATIRLLLSSLEEAMKCNGDVRLASLRPSAESALRMAGVSRLFEIYGTTEAAAQSFQRPTTMSHISTPGNGLNHNTEIAA
jgi:anti-anti-sigma factor